MNPNYVQKICIHFNVALTRQKRTMNIARAVTATFKIFSFIKNIVKTSFRVKKKKNMMSGNKKNVVIAVKQVENGAHVCVLQYILIKVGNIKTVNH